MAPGQCGLDFNNDGIATFCDTVLARVSLLQDFGILEAISKSTVVCAIHFDLRIRKPSIKTKFLLEALRDGTYDSGRGIKRREGLESVLSLF